MDKKKVNILITGEFTYLPLGRHALSFLELLSKDKNNYIYCDITLKWPSMDTYLSHFFSQENCHLSTSLPFDFQYDFAFYTHLVPLYWRDCQYERSHFKNRNAIIKGYYCVFDGTMPPIQWVDFINKNFDLCLAPSRFIANVLKQYGVSIDCFGLHCLVLNNNHLKIRAKKVTQNKKYRFGFVGSLDFKKDAIKTIEAFSSVFNKKDNVELFFHINSIPDALMKKKFNEVFEKNKHKTNLILSQGFVSDEQMLDIFSNFDAYLFPEKITGYFTTLVEALSIGIPVISSDVPPLIEIKDYINEKHNIFFVNYNEIVPAFHSFAHYLSLGCSFDTQTEKLAEKISDVYKNRIELNNDVLIDSRKNEMKKLSSDFLDKNWNNLIRPNRYFINNNFQGILEDAYCMSENLYNKYKKINIPLLEGKVELSKMKNEKYWYQDNDKFKTYEEMSFYHQNLITSLIEQTVQIEKKERNYEREFLNSIKYIFEYIWKFIKKNEFKKNLFLKFFRKVNLYVK